MSFDPPKSRTEAILQNMLGANNVLEPPKSRVEALLIAILNAGGGGLTPEQLEEAIASYLEEHPIDAVLYTEQSLTDAQKEQVRANIHALSADTQIPAAVTEQIVAGWGFTKNAGTYVKPVGGIPALDLAQGVIPDVSGKADKADVYTKTEVDQKLVGAMDYKGTKATVSELPISGNATGDVWHITADGSEWAWNGSAWEELGTAVDLSGYRTASEQDTIDAAQNTAISAKYTKPNGGIPKSDFAADVQASLGKADTALQQHQSLTGYATQAWVNGKGYLTLADLPVYNGGVS